MPPQVTCKPDVFKWDEIPVHLEKLLMRAFEDRERVIIEKMFTSGRSGADTFLVNFEPAIRPMVVKLLPGHKYQQEVDAYKAHIMDKDETRFPQFTASTRLNRCRCTDDGRWGILVCDTVEQAPLESANSLRTFFAEAGGIKTGELLERLFRRHGNLWWGNSSIRVLYVNKEYDHLLPAHLELVSIDSAPPNADRFEAGVSAARLATLAPGTEIIVEGFTVDEVTDNKETDNTVSVSALPRHAEAGPVRLRFVGVPEKMTERFQEGKPMPQQAAKVVQTRLGLLAEAAGGLALAGFDPIRDHKLTIAGFELQNPLPKLDDLLKADYHARFSLIHGDFNLENTRIPKDTNHGWLIDFAQVRKGPTLFDLQRLEVEITTHLLAPVIEQEADLSLQDALSLLQSLHTHEPPQDAPADALQNVYDLLKHVRILATHFLHSYAEWKEYYHGLVLALLGALKFRNLPASTKALAFAAAAVAMTYKDIPLTTQLSSKPMPGPAPYKGLAFYDEDDARIFSGRNDMIASIVKRLHTLPDREHLSLRFLALIGHSGSGKSSALRAGVIPKLRDAEKEEDKSRFHLLARSALQPSTDPLRQLAAFVCQEADDPHAVDELAKKMQPAYDSKNQDAVQSLDRYIAGLMADHPRKRLLLAIDAFEELYTMGASENMRHAFVNNLLFAAGPEGHAAVVIACRSDFYPQLIDTPHLCDAVADYQVPVQSMGEVELMQVIRDPVRRNGLRLQEGLDRLLLDEVSTVFRSETLDTAPYRQSIPAALPLLSEVLLQTWVQRRGNTLTIEGYYATGRIQGVIARVADKVYADLDEDEQRIAKRVLVQLANPGEMEGMGTKRRLELAELTRRDESEQVEAVVDKLVKGRLLVSGLQSSSHINGVEIVHEALIREWPQLRRWLEAVREDRGIQDKLTADAQIWADSNRKDFSVLYEGNKRERASSWARRNSEDVVEPVPDFLTASFVQELLRNSNSVEVSRLLEHVVDDLETEQLRQALQEETTNLKRKALERYFAGIALAQIGDERPGVGLMDSLPDIEWCYIPKGEFVMGDGHEEHKVWVESFAISKYPITNTQFVSYVQAVGSDVTGVDIVLTSDRPGNHPAEVTWYQALGFCEWLSAELSRRYCVDIEVTLPTEAQWEKAARGGFKISVHTTDVESDSIDNPLPNRPYPWVSTLVDFDEMDVPFFCNVYETGLRNTSSVGLFPNGASPYGCFDMAGNVLEWTSSKYREYPYTADDDRDIIDDSDEQRTLRGGSYAYFARFALCTARGIGNVRDPDGDGFRIVSMSVAHLLPSVTPLQKG